MLDQLNIYSERFSYRLSIGPRALTTSIDFYFNITFCVHIQSERAHTNNSQSILFHIEFVLDVEHSMNERFTERKINERTDKGWKRNRRVDRKLSEREREREFTKITTDFNKNYRSRKFALAISTTFLSFSGNWFLTTPFAFNYTKDPREEWW